MNQPRTLEQWLEWQSGLHPSEIELGLGRVSRVLQALNLPPLNRVITVAGTNGKGTTVAAYEAWLHTGGHKVASYTSPHLLRYNERVRLARHAVSDADLCRAFERVDEARDDTRLTYFEFGTLAALILIAEYQPDYALLEVGLGGRLDAVNVVDPDLAHITTIGLDHQAWLGNDLESIGREKAGILRPGCTAVCSDADAPFSIVQRAEQLGCKLLLAGRDYQLQSLDQDHFQWQCAAHDLVVELPLAGRHQAANFAGVLAGLDSLGLLRGLDARSINRGFESIQLAGRIQHLRVEGKACDLIVDVGHNPLAASAIAAYLRDSKNGRKVNFILGMLDDKDVAGFVRELSDLVDIWSLVSLPGERGLSARQLQQRSAQHLGRAHLFDSVSEALSAGLCSAANQDILFVAGSFLTVEAVFKSPGLKLI